MTTDSYINVWRSAESEAGVGWGGVVWGGGGAGVGRGWGGVGHHLQACKILLFTSLDFSMDKKAHNNS